MSWYDSNLLDCFATFVKWSSGSIEMFLCQAFWYLQLSNFSAEKNDIISSSSYLLLNFGNASKSIIRLVLISNLLSLFLKIRWTSSNREVEVKSPYNCVGIHGYLSSRAWILWNQWHGVIKHDYEWNEMNEMKMIKLDEFQWHGMK